MDLNEFIKLALEEDGASDDYTSLACIDTLTSGKAEMLIKEDGIIAGIEVARNIFTYLDKKFIIECFVEDGQKVKKGDIGFFVKGSMQEILKAERFVLNIMQRMSGIATETSKYKEQLHGLNTKVLDTRKTSPLFRMFEKWAVRIGGGENHRMGLNDMILIKDNHVDVAGGIEKAIDKVQDYLKRTGRKIKVEIETRNLYEVKQVLKKGFVDRIMLDNFNISELTEAVKIINHQFETEASGGITLKNARSYAETGIDFISVGSLTHSYKSLDLSLKVLKHH
ncbi:MAG TPA: carboxylating nicotinate-nucleotide diphosphorylase [Bacteroidia bacterium]|nr:carboxylating nicotinate-nucleotide diphosphorylase [Bacteroidia bacterium]